MNIYNRYLPPLVVDYSALHSLLFDMDTSLILLSPGGCNQPIKGIDEDRDTTNKNQYTTKLNDALITYGVESLITEEFIKDINMDVEFISVLGTAVTNITGTNLSFISKKLERLTNKPTIYFDTNGFDNYSKAISNAYLKLIPFIINDQKESSKKKINLIGYTRLIHGQKKYLKQIVDYLVHENIEVCLPGIKFENCNSKLSKYADLSIVISEEGEGLAKYLETEYNIPYEKILPISKYGLNKMITLVEEYTGEEYKNYDIDSSYEKELVIDERKNILILGEPFIALNLKKALNNDFKIDNVDIISLLPKKSFDKKIQDYICEDISFDHDESNFIEKIKNADIIISDPLLSFSIEEIKIEKLISLPYVALSGREYIDMEYEYIGNKGYKYLSEKLIENGVLKNEEN